MQLSVTFLALLSVITASIAAPTPAVADHSLVARGRIRKQLHDIKDDTKQLFCNIKVRIISSSSLNVRLTHLLLQ